MVENASIGACRTSRMPSSWRPGTATKASTGRAHADDYDRRWRSYHGPLLDAADDRRSPTGCSTSAAAPDRPPATWRGPRALARRWASTCRPACSRRPASQGRRRRRAQRDVRAGRRAGPPVRSRLLRRGAEPHRGDVLRRPRPPRSPTSPRALRPVAGSLCWPGSRPTRNEWIQRVLRCAGRGSRPARRLRRRHPGPFALADPDQVRSRPRCRRVRRRRRSSRCRRRHVVRRRRRRGPSSSCWGSSGWMLEGLDEPGARPLRTEALRATSRRRTRATDGVVFGSAAWLTTRRPRVTLSRRPGRSARSRARRSRSAPGW